MGTDSMGHYIPIVNTKNCIECNACVKVCPENNPVIFNEPVSCFASWSLIEQERQTSSSGGIAAELATYIVNNSGVVYGCIFETPFQIIHKRIDSIDELIKLKGSKYVQSDTKETFKAVKSDLKNKREVLYIGTPCQIAGLRSFLKKEYDNLYTVDLICHGVPSIQILKDRLKKKVDQNLSFDSILFRNSTSYKLSLCNSNGIVYSKSLSIDPFMKGFFCGLFNRESCFNCQYAQAKRCADITLGDFWGIGTNNSVSYSIKDGISLVLCNSDKGKSLLSKIKENLYIEQREIKEAATGNSQLRSPVKKRFRTKLFRKLYPVLGFDLSVFCSIPLIMIKGRIKYLFEK